MAIMLKMEKLEIKKEKKGKNKDQENTKGKELVKEIIKKPNVPRITRKRYISY